MSTADTPSSDRGPYGRRIWLAASIVLLALIVIAGIGLAIVNAKTQAVTVNPSTGQTTTTQVARSDASTCGLPAVQLDGTLTTAPTGATWSLVGTIAAPAVDGAGPGKIDSTDGYRSCYAHTPTGAVTAAYNLSAIASNPPLRERFLKEGITGASYDQVTAASSAGSGGDTGVRMQFAGFRVIRYNAAQADVDLAVRASNGVYVGMVIYLGWDKGDWKMRVSSNGSSLLQAAKIPSLSGYVPWGGV